VAVLVDPPKWPAHGRLWGHLVSDHSYDELHDFASGLGIPRRGFDGDHYDLPEEFLAHAIAAGAHLVSSAELVVRLRAAGLRRRKSPAAARDSHDNAPFRRSIGGNGALSRGVARA
jgi:hypothetical protein